MIINSVASRDFILKLNRRDYASNDEEDLKGLLSGGDWVIVVGSLITISLDLYRPLYIKYALEELEMSGRENVDPALLNIYIWSGLAFLRFVVWRVIGYTNNRFQPKVISDLMNLCYKYILQHSHNFFANNFSGSIQTRVRKFAYAFRTVAGQLLFDLGRSIVLVIFLILSTLYYDLKIGLILVAWASLYFGVTYYLTKIKLVHDLALAKQDTKVTAHLADTITNHSNINLFAAHDQEVVGFGNITDKLYQLRKKSWDYGQLADVFQGIIMMALELIVMTGIIKSWQQGTASFGDIAFVQVYLGRVFEHTWRMGKNMIDIYEALADADEMTEMLNEKHEVVDVSDAKDIVVSEGNIVFDKATFSYNGSNSVFNNFNLEIAGGEKIAFVGDSGGGKTTLVKLLLRLMDTQSGRILIDGQDISLVTQNSLHRQVTLVPQDPSLFHRSLRDNIIYGKPDATEEEMIAAAKAAHCHEFISTFPDGYNTFVGERGVKLSGGQRQRVAIARAILCNSPILIFDEATSSLDSESESYIQKALKNLMKDKTSIVIAHRLSTIKEMDRIIVIDGGNIIEQGDHVTLLTDGGKYSKHWEIQSGGFVIDAKAA
mgnify:CR=1 FL=1